LPTDKWASLNFDCPNERKANLVAGARNFLNDRGVRFDSGGFADSFDWEIDWSFRVEGNEYDIILN